MKKKEMFDSASSHILFEDGNVRAFERRWVQVIIDARGIPRARVPDGVSFTVKMGMLQKDERIRMMFALIPIQFKS